MPAPLEPNSVNFSFPCVASPTRTAQIQGSLDKITVGMTVDATVRILGEPDEVLPLYEPKGLEPEQIGTTRWYYVRIDSPEERTAAQLMRLSADHENLITAIDHWGISAQLEWLALTELIVHNTDPPQNARPATRDSTREPVSGE